jgi:hypothetical protein
MPALYARPNLNGNSPKNFTDLARDYQQLANQLEALNSRLFGDVMHGRNYQTVELSSIRRDQDLDNHVAVLNDMVNTLTALSANVYMAGTDK